MDFCVISYVLLQKRDKTRQAVYYNVTIRRERATIVAVEKQ